LYVEYDNEVNRQTGKVETELHRGYRAQRGWLEVQDFSFWKSDLIE
jgi:hypothetical protein